MLIQLGHDLQVVRELSGREDLETPGVFLTESEHAYIEAQRSPLQSMAAIFSAKEAFFKAAPETPGAFWTDIEILHDERRAPFIKLHGELGKRAEKEGWSVRLSISHSGEYVSTVVLIVAL